MKKNAEQINDAEQHVDSVEPGGVLADWLRAELDRRLQEYESDPEAGESWEQVRGEISSERVRRGVLPG